MTLIQSFTNPSVVEIHQSRWNVVIKVIDNGKEYKLIVSADSGLTYGDGIWLGTPEEYEEEIERF